MHPAALRSERSPSIQNTGGMSRAKRGICQSTPVASGSSRLATPNRVQPRISHRSPAALVANQTTSAAAPSVASSSTACPTLPAAALCAARLEGAHGALEGHRPVELVLGVHSGEEVAVRSRRYRKNAATAPGWRHLRRVLRAHNAHQAPPFEVGRRRWRAAPAQRARLAGGSVQRALRARRHRATRPESRGARAARCPRAARAAGSRWRRPRTSRQRVRGRGYTAPRCADGGRRSARRVRRTDEPCQEAEIGHDEGGDGERHPEQVPTGEQRREQRVSYAFCRVYPWVATST